MYVFGMDVPLVVLIVVGLGLHIIELLLVLQIMRKIRKDVIL